ncbi:MAG: ABC transporter substrate-binding protein [Micavibrio aeruginosavorus]|uniref:ABC transporter substrate-binding protein n=1 Tax=Micavibrio aeruginosavorus TaxID=349221 RepID=A0A7T5R4N9_9BACT|nr:MAG: ABC transporter substrate-binding protein [Micavibrio aeruginosavorus]
MGIMPARAEILYGLAMNDTPKYASGASHLDYVNPNAPKGGTLTQSAIGTFDNLNPFNIKGTVAQGLSLVHDRLMQRVWDEPFTLYPLIAEKIDVPTDRSAITFYLDPRAKFQNGTPITADDILFSFQTLKEKGRPNMRRIYALVDNAEKHDDHTVHFSLGEGYDRETVMILAMMPVLSKAWWEGREFDATTLDIPNASGPYKIAQIDPGRKIIYERNPAYWAANLMVNKGQYNFDRMVFDYYRDDTVAFEAFKSGEFDLRREADAGKWAKGYDFPAAKNGMVKVEMLAHGRPEKVRSLIFNIRRPPFDDARVREALSLALDFEWMNANLYHGLYRRVNSYYPNSELAAGDWIPPSHKTPAESRTNLKKADELLKDAGWIISNGQRIKQDSPTTPLTFEIMLGSPDDEKVALAFARNLKKLGVEPRVRVLDSAAFTGRLNEYDYDMVLHFWLSTLSPGTEQVLYYGCEAGKQKARWNFPGICDPKIDTLALSVANAPTRADMMQLVKELDRALLAGHYMIPLNYAGVDYVAYKSRLQRPDVLPLYGMVLESWWTSPDQ